MVRTIDLPDLGAVSDTSSIVADKAGSGRFLGSAVKSYCLTNIPTEAPTDGKTYGRLSAAWSPVLPIAGGAITGTLSVAGAVTFSGTLGVTGNATFSGTLNATGAITCNSAMFSETLRTSSVNGYEWTHFVAANGDHHQQHRTGWDDVWQSGSGQRQWTSPSGNLMTLDGTGNLVLSATCAATQFWSGGVGIFGFTPGGSGRIFQFAPGFYLDYATTGGTLAWTVSNGPLWVMRASDDFCFNPQSAVGGNGAYINSSDRRMKTGIAPTSKGLAEVLQLQPVAFTRADPTTGAQEEIGFVAQDVQPVLPEAVWTAGIPLRDGTGGLDDPEPTLGLSGETITAINVNAIKELNALISALTDRVAALEAAP
jgi:hypothetical protein